MKSVLSAVLALLVVGCSSGVVGENPIPAGHNISNLCLKGNFESVPDYMMTAFQTSLGHKNLTVLKRVKDNFDDCRYVLAFRAEADDQILDVAKVKMTDLSNKKVIGVAVYKNRGEQKDKTNPAVLQMQVDSLINALFKNY